MHQTYTRRQQSEGNVIVNKDLEAEADYVVIGGGSAGCTLAARLSEDPSVSVVLI